jgi:2,4-dienoyl-CoA reductase-like NADH-dependent reductase (Old Yellow Enzyme family)
MARAGLVTDRLIEWHRAFAAGGVGMSTLAYCSVSSEGRTFGDQIWMRDEAEEGLRRFADAMHAEGARAGIQLGHAGWFAHPRATGCRPIGPSATFSPHSQRFSRAMKEADFDRMTREFADAARLAVRAGFDALEVHMGHGYLLSQFLSPYNNRRGDRWGGSLENRARFPRQVMRAVREAAGPSVAVYPKLNMDDGFRGGLTLDEGIEVARLFASDGSIDALQLTGGHTTRTPMYLMRGDVPLKEMIQYERDWVRKLGLVVFGRFLIKAYPFEEAFFLQKARRFKDAVDVPIMLLGGVTQLDTMNQAIAEGFRFIALGRALICEPDLMQRMASGDLKGSSCNHCNQCIAEMEREAGVRCVLHASTPPD